MGRHRPCKGVTGQTAFAEARCLEGLPPSAVMGMSVKPTIRAPREDEWEQLARLLRVSFQDEGPEIGGTIDTAESVSGLRRYGNQLFLMELGARLVGFVYLDIERKAAFKLAVDPEFRNKGYGRKLMEAAEKRAQALGWNRLLVGVMDNKQSLLTYYGNLGYSATGDLKPHDADPGYTGPVHYFIILGKSLVERAS
jgi:GNAT superfamily N-acetyltransferase